MTVHAGTRGLTSFTSDTLAGAACFARGARGHGSDIPCGVHARRAAHLWEFDAVTGKGTNPGNSQLTVFDTRVTDGNVEVFVPGPG